ncbi:MAG: isoprenylcysteine carboxylmethyltransferase family protein [Anaerolineales bacterium]|nr:isoprenylcysteine carboxylmethyltransferase family protein [Anaerolineales bacterium]
MRFEFTQVFLLVWIIAFWIFYLLTYGKYEEKHERSTRAQYGVRSKWAPFFGLAFLGWTLVMLVYFFHPASATWLWRFSALDREPVKWAGVFLMCIAFLLNILFTLSIGKSIRDALATGGKAQLITTGVYRLVRHPGYAAFFLVGLGCFLILPNVIVLGLLLYTCIAIHGQTLEEEEKLVKMYGESYEQYRRKTGRYWPRAPRSTGRPDPAEQIPG